jgi:hypothetical protein
LPSATLSPDVDSVIHRLQISEYHTIDNSEASVCVVVELLILDRLHHFSDKGLLEHLQLYPEVDVNLLRGNTYVTGRADWLLCHDDPQYGIDSTLIAIEAKRSCEFSCADRQMATYLAAVQDCRAKIQKIHAIAFGITTDSTRYQFWFIDSKRRLFSSVIFDWRLDKAKVIAWIDKMLAKAIEASPLTTLTLRRNVSLRNWEKDFRRRQLLSSESDDSPVTEGLPFDISVPDSCQLVHTTEKECLAVIRCLEEVRWLPPIKAKIQWKKMKTSQLEKDKDAMTLLNFFRGTPLWRYYCDDRTYASKKSKDQWKMEKDLPKDLQRIVNEERKPGQTPISLTPEQIRALTKFAPTIRSWFPHAFRLEGQLKTQFVYLLEEVNPKTQKFTLPPRVIHSNYPCLIGDHLVRVQEGSDQQEGLHGTKDERSWSSNMMKRMKRIVLLRMDVAQDHTALLLYDCLSVM